MILPDPLGAKGRGPDIADDAKTVCSFLYGMFIILCILGVLILFLTIPVLLALEIYHDIL